MSRTFAKKALYSLFAFLRYIFFVYRIAFNIWPRYIFVVFFKSATEVLQVFIYPLGTSKIIELVFDAYQGENVTFQIFAWLLILIIIGIVDGLFTNIFYVHANVFAEKTRAYLSNKAAHTLNSVPYAYFEDKQFQTDLKTFETIAMPKFVNSTDYLPRFMKSAFVFIVSLGIFIFKYPVALLIIFGVLVEMFTVRHYVLKYNKQRDKIAGVTRYVDYFVQQILGLTNYRLNKVYSLYKYLGGKLLSYSRKLQNTLFILNKDLAKGRVKSSLVGVIVGRFIPWIYYTYLAIKKRINPQEYVFIFSLISNVYSKIFVAMRVMLELLSASDYYDILDIFVNGNYPATRLSRAKAVNKVVLISGKIKLKNLKAIEAKNIWFKYPDSREWVLRDFSLKLEQGKPVLITGPNGVGKTTLFYIIYGLFKPQKGKIIINGQYNLCDIDLTSYQKQIGYVLQENPQLYLELRDNVALLELKEGLIKNLKGSGIKKLKRALNFATLSELVSLVDKNTTQLLGKFFAEGKELSGGQWRKLAIARLFYADPAVWLLDEPFVNIDVKARKKILENIINYALDYKRILVMVSHLPEVKEVFQKRIKEGLRILSMETRRKGF